MSEQDEVKTRIGAGVERGRAGDRDSARAILGEVWDQLGPDGDPLHVVALAHYLADMQDDPADELEWDQRALRVADQVTDERASQAGVPGPVAGFYPSLYLNLALDYGKLNDPDAARSYLTKAELASPELPDGEYGDGIRAAILRLREELNSGTEQGIERSEAPHG